jgi:hypothetical protein
VGWSGAELRGWVGGKKQGVSPLNPFSLAEVPYLGQLSLKFKWQLGMGQVLTVLGRGQGI